MARTIEIRVRRKKPVFRLYQTENDTWASGILTLAQLKEALLLYAIVDTLSQEKGVLPARLQKRAEDLGYLKLEATWEKAPRARFTQKQLRQIRRRLRWLLANLNRVANL